MQTIYILDYDTDIAYALCAWFKANGFEAKHFSTLEQLLLQLQTQQPDCIILDCLFGRISLTSEICYTIQNIFHYNGKILLTSTSTISVKDLKVCNAAAFIPKPFDFGKILQQVNEVTGTSLVESVAR
jgi:FixJ family two-component response regulator